MKQLKESLAVLKSKETQFSGGNICVSSCGSFLLCIYGTCVNVIDINTGETVNKLESEEEEISCITLSPDDQHLITAHRNLLLKQWNNWKERDSITTNTTTKCSRTWKAIHTAPIQFMTFDATSTLLATGSSDFTTKVWDIKGQYCTHNLKGAQGIINHVRFHPLMSAAAVDTQKCITGSEDGKLRVYNLRTSQLESTLDGHYSAITCFEFFNENNNQSNYRHLISSSRDKVVIVWDLVELKQLRTIAVHESIESLILLDDHKHFISMGSEGLLKLWNIKSGRCLVQQNEKHSLKINKARQSKEMIDLAPCIVQGVYNQSTKSIIMLTVDQLVSFVRINEKMAAINVVDSSAAATNQQQQLFTVYKQFVGSHGEILDMSLLNKSENLLALATNSEFIKVYDLNTWDCQLLKGHTDLVLCLSSFAIDDNLSYLASSSKDNTIRIWKFLTTTISGAVAYTYECVATLQGHTQDVGAICFSNMSLAFLVSGSIDTTLKIWRITHCSGGSDLAAATADSSSITLKCISTVKAHEKDINCVCVSPNDKLIASGSSDRTAKVYDAADGSCLAVLRGHKRGIWSMKFSPVDQLIATSSADATIKLWSLSDFTCFKTFEGHNTSVLRISFLNNGTQMISSASDGLVKLWNVKTNECVSTFDEHADKIWALCVSKDESKYLTGGADGKLILWKDVTEEKVAEEMEKREEIVLKEQELENFLKEKKWRKALGLAILLNKPFKCYEIIKNILQTTSDGTKKDGRADLERTLLKLRDDQIKSLVNFAVEWNTNTKFCHLAQTLLELILRNYPPEFLLNSNNNEATTSMDAAKLIEQFMPYSERHYARLNKLAQQIMFIDFAWSNMKLSDESLTN